MFEKLYNKAIDTDACIVQCNFKEVYPNETKLKKYPNFNPKKGIIHSLSEISWNKIYKKSIFIENNIWFPEKLTCEDLVTTLRLLFKCKTIESIDNYLYYYRKSRPGAITTNTTKILDDVPYLYDVLKKFLIEEKKWNTNNFDVKMKIWSLIVKSLSNYSDDGSIPKKEKKK